jgi:hypothetical protein
MMAWPFPPAESKALNRKRVLRRTAGFKTVQARQRFYGLLRRMRAKLVLSKTERD